MAVEIARQRALQAAEYYHQTVLQGSQSPSTNASPDPEGDLVESHLSFDDVMSANENDALRVGVTPASSDSVYRAKMRAGFIDLRNSYNEKINSGPGARGAGGSTHRAEQPRRPKVYSKSHATPVVVGDHAQGNNMSKISGGGASDRPPLHRSNSSLELEHTDYLNHDDLAGNLRRDYGSANSLDMLSTSGDSFFAMLQDYRNENLDQRAPPPPQMQRLLRGNVALEKEAVMAAEKEPLGPKVSNGSAQTPTDEDTVDGSQSPRMKSKSAKNKDRKFRAKSVGGDSLGIMRILRGVKNDTESNSKAQSPGDDMKPEERLRRKAMTHYDVQSVCFSLGEVIKRRNSLHRRRNTTTGASAASGVRSHAAGEPTEEEENGDNDEGDGKSNDLVLNCPFFRNELGGEEERQISLTRSTAHKRVQQLLGKRNVDMQSMVRRAQCNGISVLDTSVSVTGVAEPSMVSHKGFIIEHVDTGAFYYRNFFYGYEHQNYFGIDDTIGPVAISIRREKLDEGDNVVNKTEGLGAMEKQERGQYQYRVMARTSELQALRGIILEDAIPSSSRLSSSRGLPAKDFLEYAVPEINLASLRLATPGVKTADQLLKLDEQGITKKYKVGIMYCKAGQSTEEEMYNNEFAGGAFDEFLDCIGQRVRLKGFERYRAGLDNKTDSTGTHSLYASFQQYEVMFHVSTMLPYTANNRQQLLRKRHIGNDIVTIVFQEPGAMPFTPKAVRSHFQHVFILVRAHDPCSDNVRYSVAVTRSKDVPPFGPSIPEGATFNKGKDFADFLIVKALNAENAAHKSDKFSAMATRTKQEYLKDLATNYVTTQALDSGSKLSKFSLGSGRKKDRSKGRVVPDFLAKSAVVWMVQVEDFGQSTTIYCYFAIAPEAVILVEEGTNEVVFTVPCRSVIGWTSTPDSLRIYYDHGECVVLRVTCTEPDEVLEIVNRLSLLTQGCETVEMTLRRNGLGQLGFHVHYEGIISDVEAYGFAWQAGLRQGSRMVEICKVATATLTHDQMVDLLRTSVTVKVVVIPPLEDGTPRRGCEDTHSSYSSLTSHNTSSSSNDHMQEDDSVTTVSSKSTVKSVSTKTSGSTRADFHPSNTPPGERLGRHATSLMYGSHGNVRLLTLHMESRLAQSKHEAQGSRTSSGHGSMEGQSGSDSQSRDLSSEGYGSRHSDDRLFRSSQENLDARGRSWLSRAVASYNKEQPNDRWYDTADNLDVDQGSSFLSNSDGGGYITRLVPTSNQSAFIPVSKKLSNHVPPEHAPHLGSREDYVRTPPSGKHGTTSRASNDGGYRSDVGKVTNSHSNLSQLSDISSHSSGTGSARSYQHLPNSRDPNKDDKSIKKPTSFSPIARPRGTPYPGGAPVPGKRTHLDVSPVSSGSSSPKSSNRNNNLSRLSSEESLATRLRPGVSLTSKPPSGKVVGNSNSFQEDLMRLINPDVSDSDIRNKTSRQLFNNRSPGRLQRTLSDESLCGVATTKPARMGTSDLRDYRLGSDVIFTTAVPAEVTQGGPYTPTSKQYRSSPHGVGGAGGGGGGGDGNNMLRVSGPVVRTSSSPILPLPDAASGLDWSNLVETATKAFQGVDVQGGGEPPQIPERQRQKPESQTKVSSHQGASAHDRSTFSNSSSGSHASSVSWHSSGGSPHGQAHRLRELENRCDQLQRDLDKESREKAYLEAEVHQLRQDNLRLQEESQTAASQLRKFTEWFFNTIDRQ